MCGIFGVILKENSGYPVQAVDGILRKVAKYSQVRGKDSSGIALRNDDNKCFSVIKGDVPIQYLLNSDDFSNQFSECLTSYKNKSSFLAFGHARLVTNGSQLQEQNNQPVIKNDIITIHNGIIVNADNLWTEFSQLKREFLIDTEIIPALLRHELSKNIPITEAFNNTFRRLKGTFSVACAFNDLNQFVLATNNGSLYYITDNKNYLIFASEEFFLTKLICDPDFLKIDNSASVRHLKPNTFLIINFINLFQRVFQFSEVDLDKLPQHNLPFFYKIDKYLIDNNREKKEVVIEPLTLVNSSEKKFKDILEYNITEIGSLKRCSKCLLPVTFPYIEFDDKGVCNYCNNHKKKAQVKPFDDLKELIKKYKLKNGRPDCIVPFSGGRDSTFVLHFVKKELGLNPIAFTYDWGMVTDLARRNIARVCGKLGVENIIVSADIHWKRKNIRKNIQAWLKKPDLGMIPLFMAGDKYFFYYTDRLKKQTGIKLNIWGINQLENTDFKVGFSGVKPKFDKKTIYSLSIASQLNLFKHVGKNIVTNPAYINESVFDTLGSFASRYIAPKKDYFHFFDFYQWNEKEIENLILNEYDWETAIDTNTTWRIGDGTAGFYNYVYYTVAGFSEYDTFRSNQIREGMISREEALKKVMEENKPRFESILWYTKIVGLDFETVVKRINEIPKLYRK